MSNNLNKLHGHEVKISFKNGSQTTVSGVVKVKSVVGEPFFESDTGILRIGDGEEVQPIAGFLGWANYVDSEYTEGSPFSLPAASNTVMPNDMAGATVSGHMPRDLDTMYYAGYLDYDAKVGVFTRGATASGNTSGATANILSVIDNGETGRLLLSNINGTFQDNETITDTNVGQATISGTIGPGAITGKNGDAYAITLDFKVKPTNASTNYIEVWFDIGGAVGELYRRISTFPKGTNQERSIVHSTAIYSLDTWEANGATVYMYSDNTCDVYDIRFIVYRLYKARTLPS